MTILYEDGIPRFQEKYEISTATELSSRPERSVVEISAVRLSVVPNVEDQGLGAGSGLLS
jgi:hypothetical protein